MEPPAGTTVDESCGFDPGKSRGGYDRSKAQASLDVLKAVKQGLNAVIACPTGVIGPYDYRGSIMGRVIRDLALNSIRAMPAEGGYDFVDVRDVATGLILAAEKGKAGEAYILSGEYISIRELGALVDKLCGRKPVGGRLYPCGSFWPMRTAQTCCAASRKGGPITRYSIKRS